MRCLRLSALVTLWSLAVVPFSIVYTEATNTANTGTTTPTSTAGGERATEGGAGGGGTGANQGGAAKAATAAAKGKQDAPAEESFSVCTLGVITTTGMLLFVI